MLEIVTNDVAWKRDADEVEGCERDEGGGKSNTRMLQMRVKRERERERRKATRRNGDEPAAMVRGKGADDVPL